MASDDYAPPPSGTLKLKGNQPSKITKKKKKSKPKKAPDPDPPAAAATPPTDNGSPGVGKTEAELRHEEMRRKRLNDRIKREGVKSHKERVEDLNKYLSTLSEHHDMPRIGPG